MIPRTPIARARVSVSASIREPTTRIVPASPTSSRAGAQLARPVARSRRAGRPRVGPPRATMPRRPRPGRPDARCRSRAGPRGRCRRAGSRSARRARRRRRASGRASSNSSSPSRRRRMRGPAAGVSSGRRQRRSATHRRLDEPGVAQPLGDRRAGDDRLAGGDQRPVARRERGTSTSIGPSTDGAGRGRARGPAGEPAQRRRQPIAAPDRRAVIASRPRPQRRLPRREQVAPAIGPLGQAQRDVAQVDEQAAEPARDVDGEVPAARPEPDGSRNRNSAMAVSPGGRSTSSSPPGTRSMSLAPVPAWTVSAAGDSARPEPGRGDDAAERRQQVVDEVGIRPAALARRRGSPRARRAAGRGRGRTGMAPGRRRTSASARATAGAGTDAHAPPAAMTRSGAGGGRRSGVAADEPAERGPRGGHAGARRPRRPRPPTARSAARASGRAGGAGRAAPSTRPARRRRSRRRGRRGRPRPSATTASAAVASWPPAAGVGRGPEPASWPSTIVSTRRSRTSARACVAGPIARRGSSAGSASSSSSSPSGSGAGVPPRLPVGAAGPSSDLARSRRRASPKASSPSAIAPASTTVSSGRAAATAATSAASSRRRRRSSARRRVAGADEDGRRRRGRAAAATSPAGRWSPRSLAERPASRCLAAAATSGGERPFRAATTARRRGRRLRDLEARQLRRAGRRRRRRPMPTRPARGRPADAGADRARIRRPRPASAPRRARRACRAAARRPPTRPIERRGRWSRTRGRWRGRRAAAVVTARCYPGVVARPRRAAPAVLGDATPVDASGVPGDLFVELLEPRDQQLDAGVVGEDLARPTARSPPNTPAQHRVEEQHRVRAERPVRPARLEEVDRRTGQAAQLDLAGDLLDELVALLLGRARTRGSRRIGLPVAPCDAAGPRRAGRRVERGLERLVGGRAAHREDDVLDARRAAARRGRPRR